MPISLFPHNQRAYTTAAAMLQAAGKAAIIHPTGTGKSFIGFRLCEDHPDQRICWLSPSEYIFKTQLENLTATGAQAPANITFLTYAKLMLMDEAELSEIQPAYIILDEFHRCGAEQWGRGVQNLLNLYAGVPILGLSATNIRYLDSQRDMADELFDGNVASEMTLGEAIARGILSPPTYVISLYSCQKDLERYQAKIRRAKNKAARDEAQQYLDAVRRALEKADGLDEIFQKHIPDKAGKYIVFCASLEHMDEMMGHVPEWFSGIDKSPHLYRAYSDDPATSQAFADFKADRSEHLKLLFCVDMLNEGVHMEDVSGVILLRPTVSPIIYKQQIGRALCAGRKKNPVIFDIVNNFENLLSIGAIEEEMRAAITYYRFLGEEKEIVTERFRIIDETRNCRTLFDAMNEALTASWDLMYECARGYCAANGHLEVPYKYRTPEGYSLGSWLHTQRRVRAGEVPGKLGEDRIAKLDALGMVWNSYLDLAWERHYREAKEYVETHGDLNTNVNCVTPSGFALGQWICNLRVARKHGIRQSQLTPQRIHQLDELGMIWDVPDYLWEANFAEAMAYYRAHGHLDVPYRYISPNGIKLGVWIRRLRAIREGRAKGASLSPEQIARLDSIGMRWEDAFTRQWERGFREAQAYFEAHGSLDVPTGYVTPSGFKLGAWIANHREQNGIRVTPQRRQRLDAIGMIWSRPDPWEVRYALAKTYFEAHGDLHVPAQYKVDGVWLNKWLNEQKQIYRGNRPGKRLTADQIRRLEAIGMMWDKGRRANPLPFSEPIRPTAADRSALTQQLGRM